MLALLFALLTPLAAADPAGVGVALMAHEGRAYVVAVVRDGPASAAGLTPGDELLRVGGRSPRRAGIAPVLDRLRGRAGTRVRLVWEDPAGTRTSARLVRAAPSDPDWVPLPPGAAPSDLR